MKTSPKPRKENDRRQQDNGPPAGWSDRRRSTERRIPEIEECAISEAEWELYFGKTDAGKTGD